MHRAARAAFSSSVLIVVGAIGAHAASMGSLAPHDVTSNSSGQPQQQWITDPRTGCRALDFDFDPGDGIVWSGGCGAGLAWGHGALSIVSNGRVLETITGTFASGVLQPGHVTAFWADGSKYDGNQLGGEFDGQGLFTSPTGDKLEGQWKAGALNGRATVTWANGDRYDGEWKDGKSDGQGTEVWADGRRYEGPWVAGKPVGNDTPVAAAPVAPSAPPALVQASAPAAASANAAIDQSASANPESAAGSFDASSSPLGPFVGTKLLSVDGSTVEIARLENGLSRLVTLPGGATQQISLAFMNSRIGTVSSDSAAIGLFRTSPGELDIDFADGTIEVMKVQAGGGLLVTARTSDGQSLCTAWYPEGHAFAAAEKRAAVEQYAARLGVAVSVPEKKSRGAHEGSRSCGGGFLEKVPQSESTAAASRADTGPPEQGSALLSAPMQTERVVQAAASATDAHNLQNVSVKPSSVHPIDAPSVASAPQPAPQPASFVVSAAAPLASLAAATAPQPGASQTPAPNAQDELNASQCLSVVSNGEYWGFQNSCAQSIQFAYCEMSESNPLTSCQHTSVVGSASANGFSPLVTDKSLAEKDVKHEFRWMACDGGAGEVVPHLDSVEPPVGRCLRVVAAAER